MIQYIDHTDSQSKCIGILFDKNYNITFNTHPVFPIFSKWGLWFKNSAALKNSTTRRGLNDNRQLTIHIIDYVEFNFNILELYKALDKENDNE